MYGLGNQLDWSELGVLGRGGEAQMPDLRVFERFSNRMDGTAGDAQPVQALDPVRGGLTPCLFCDQLIELLTIATARARRGEAPCGQQFVEPGCSTEIAEHAIR